MTKKSEAELLAEFQTEVQAAEETGDVEATKVTHY